MALEAGISRGEPGYALTYFSDTMKLRNEPILWLQIAVLLVLVFPFCSATFRDNDQAAILSGAWQIAHHQASFFHATFYNFDKQWGAFLVLSWLYRLFPQADPVLAANLLLTAAASFAWFLLAIRRHRAPLALLLPFLLSPALILYMPYFGTAWLSLAFLLLAFWSLQGRHSSVAFCMGLLLVAAAASCRADVILAFPALFFSHCSRRSLRRLLSDRRLWLLAIAAVFPVFVGKWLAGIHIPDLNPLSFDLRAYSGFLLFGLTPAILLVLLLHTGVYMHIARRKRCLFYVPVAVAPLIPLAFYSPQLYTLRYLFLTIASLLFSISSRRSAVVFRSRGVQLTVVAIAILPWCVGLRLPLLRQPSLTFANPTRFPTGDGMFPMGAYLGFAHQVFFRDHSVIDHNQTIWLSARSVTYRACPDGQVPFLITPMSNFMEFAIRLQNKRPKPIDFMKESPCGWAYVDARSILRGIRPDRRDGDFYGYEMQFVSHSENGQLIVLVNTRAPQSEESRLLRDVRDAFHRREAEVFTTLPARIPILPGHQHLIYSSPTCTNCDTGPLIVRKWSATTPAKREYVNPHWRTRFAGWARTELPSYMGL